jgi:signal transduction histidine kinase
MQVAYPYGSSVLVLVALQTGSGLGLAFVKQLAR